jgi:predicted MFS family arabinose efflux permease
MLSNKESGRSIMILMVAVAIIGCNSFLISPILNDIASSLSASTAQVSRAISAYGGATALSSLFLAPYAGKIGITRSIRYAGMLMIVGIALSGISLSWWMLTIAQSIAGVAAGLMLPAIYTLTSDVAPEGEKSQALGKVITGWSLAMVIGIPLSAVIADITNWRVAYGLMTVLGLVFLLFSKRLPVIDTPADKLGFAFEEYRKNPDILIMFVVTLLYMTSFYGLYSFVGSFARDSFYNSAALAGLITMAYGIGFGVASLKARWIDKFSPQSSACIIFITISLIYAILSVSGSSIYLLLVACLLWGAANHFGLNVIVSLLIQLSSSYKTATLGMYSALSYSGTMIGGLAYGYVFNRQGFTSIAYISLILCIIAAFLAWFIFNHKPKTYQDTLKTKNKL